MIWFEATQSRPAGDHVDVEVDAVTVRVVELAAVVREAGVGQDRLGGVGAVGGHGLGPRLDLLVRHPLREEPVEPDRVGRRRVTVLTELRHGLAVDRAAECLAERGHAVRVLRRVGHERDRIGRRRVERVEVLLVLRRVRLVDVRHEVVRPVDLPALDEGERGVVRRGLHVLEARDLRQALLPVVRVLVEDVVLRGEARDHVVRSRAHRPRVVEGRDVADLGPHVSRHDEQPVHRGCDELRVGRLQLDDDLVGASRLDGDDLVAGSGQADPVHELVLASGQEAVDDVGRGELLAVRPFHASSEVQREGLVAVAPFPASGEPRYGLEATFGRDDQRLVERPLDERAARQPGRGVGVEVLDERRVAGARHDEALVACRDLDGAVRGRRRRRAESGR